MKWPNKYNNAWHRKFAWLPVNVNGTTVWLESYWVRFVYINQDDVYGKWEFSQYQQYS